MTSATNVLESQPLIPPHKRQKLEKFSTIALRLSGIALVSTVWISATLFGLYILAFYAAALYDGNMERWNEVLPRLYEQGSATATSGIGLHFATGGIILVLGCIQLISAVRTRYPVLHRWIGRLYVVSALLAAAGGLTFIFAKGTIGGLVMDIGFSLYGILMLIAAIATYRYAKKRQLEKHRAWALRLFALAIGSWLYRMEYGFWLLLTDGLGHGRYFDGPFDQVMAFFFYIPNLVVAELFIRGRHYKASPASKLLASGLLLFATGFLSLGTYYFTLFYWGPVIWGWISGG